MDVQVEAKILMDRFLDRAEVQRLIRSHGFKVQDLGRGQVQVQGDFMELKDLKAQLDQLVAPLVPPGAGSEHHTGSDPDGGRSEPPSFSSQRHPAAQDYRTSSCVDHQGSGGSIIVDSDVFRYAQQLRTNELNSIQTGRGVEMMTREDGESTIISFQGRGSRTLQNLLDDLSQSLRTHEVPLRDLNQRGQVLLERIQQNQNISGSVLVCKVEDRLHLIGPSKDSYELKQRLLGKLIDHSGSRGRSSSVPLRGPKSSAGGAFGPSAGGAAGSSPTRRCLSGTRGNFSQKEEERLSSPGKTKRFFSSFSLKKTKRVDQPGPRGRSMATTSRGRSSSVPLPGPKSSGGGAVGPSAGGAAAPPPSGPASLSKSWEKRQSEKPDQKDKLCLLL